MKLNRNNLFNKIVRIILLVLILVIGNTCSRQEGRGSATPRNLDEIRKSGKLVAVTDNNSINYFIYRGEPMGYQYDMLQAFANYLGVKIDLVVANSLSDAFKSLNDGESDLIAINLTVTNDRKKHVAFTMPMMQTRQVLIQRKPMNWRNLTADDVDALLIRNPIDLATTHVAIYVQKGSAYERRMHNLAEEIGDSLNIISVPEDAEQLISMVAGGVIDYTVCDENAAMVSQTYNPDLDISTALSFPQNLAWAVNSNSKALLAETNKWLFTYMKSTEYALLYAKYFRDERTSYIFNSDYNAGRTGKISDYDALIKKYCKESGWDWRLVASIIYQESRFNPTAKSWLGAYGLMQLLPSTAEMYGIDHITSPADNVRAGMKVLKYLDERYAKTIGDKDQRIKFVLAAYNMGIGHVDDAQRLASKNGKNPYIWDKNVDIYMKQKSDPAVYHDPVVEFGYCRGDLAVNYVNEILDRYEHYKKIIAQK